MTRTPQDRPARSTEAAGSLPAAAAPQPSDATRRVAELQVSAHLMTLETGLFCVFQTPGSAPSDPLSGLPGVRITLAPGTAGRSDAVSVSTFREDGWLNGTAALVRVTDGSAQILVTIYQHKGQDAAPRLQVLRLSGEASAPAALEQAQTGLHVAGAQVQSGAEQPGMIAPAPDRATARPQVMAHVQRMGDVGCKLGEWLGLKGSGQWVEGFGLAPVSGLAAEDLEYQAVLGRNWRSPWVEAGKFCGSRGMALPLLGIKVRLKGAAAKTLECSYSATFVDGTAIGPVGNGEPCEADSLAAMEAFQVIIHPRDNKAVDKPKPVTAASGGKTAPKPAGKQRAAA